MPGNFFGGQFFGGGFFGQSQSDAAGRRTSAAGRKRERVVAEIDGEQRVFASLYDLIAFLQSREARLEESAEKQGEAQARRILRVRATGKTATDAYKQPVKIVSGAAAAEGAAFIAETNARLERVYRDALQGAMARDAEEAAEIAEISEIAKIL